MQLDLEKQLDTNKYFVICANVIGGCMGSYGPSDIDPNTNKILGTKLSSHYNK